MTTEHLEITFLMKIIKFVNEMVRPYGQAFPMVRQAVVPYGHVCSLSSGDDQVQLFPMIMCVPYGQVQLLLVVMCVPYG